MIEIQRVPINHGLLWINHGFRLIKRSPMQAVSLAMVFVLLFTMVPRLPIEIVFAFILTLPAWFAGYMRVCRALEYSEKIELYHLIEGFKKRAAQLILLGGLALLLAMFIGAIVALLIGAETMSTMRSGGGGQVDPNLLMKAMLASDSGILPGVMTGVVLMSILMLVMQYATMLVFFDGMTPVSAAKLALRGTIKNIIPLTVYSMLIQLLAFMLSVIPFNLGILVLLPIALTSMYVSYRDIYSAVKPAEAVKEGEKID